MISILSFLSVLPEMQKMSKAASVDKLPLGFLATEVAVCSAVDRPFTCCQCPFWQQIAGAAADIPLAVEMTSAHVARVKICIRDGKIRKCDIEVGIAVSFDALNWRSSCPRPLCVFAPLREVIPSTHSRKEISRKGAKTQRKVLRDGGLILVCA